MSAKRKAASAAIIEGDEPDAKRRKLPITNETSETTTTAGLALLAQIKQARDKRKRLIATNFLTLPDKNQIPEYYEEIVLPIALDTIEAKLQNHEYPTLAYMESDLKRMVSNAKSFNERNSEIFSDAEKVRKMVSNHMTKINPAYKDPTYTPIATPLPVVESNDDTKQEENDEADADGETDPEDSAAKPRRLVTLHGPSAEKEENRRRETSTPAVLDAADAGESFEGNTFQQAQEKLVTELIQLKNEDGEPISGLFLNLPSRELRDYYRVIKHPVCLKSVQKLVRGVKGRDKPTGVSFFKSWQSFEEEMGYIWNNARTYNEDGSEVSLLAGELEAYFERRVKEAKDAVPEPSQPKVKLKLSAKTPEPPPKITLRLGQKANSENIPGVSVDNEALKRQQDLVKAGANGTAIVSNGVNSRSAVKSPLGGSSETSTGPQAPPDRQNTTGVHRSELSNGIKHEARRGLSPALAATMLRTGSGASNEATQSPRLGVANMLPPTTVTPRPSSGSPHPQTNHLTNNHHPFNPLESRWRAPGKDASDALISNLKISSHPHLKLARPFRLDIPPSQVASQHSVTITLPATHYLLQISPTVSAHVLSRQSKTFVTVNNQRLNPMQPKPGEVEPRSLLYDARLMPGVNRIEVEIIAAPPRGAPKIGFGQDIELERVTVFANLAT